MKKQHHTVLVGGAKGRALMDPEECILKQQSEHFRTACEMTQEVSILQFVKTLSTDEDARCSNDAADQKHQVYFQMNYLTQLTQAALHTDLTEFGFSVIDLQCEKNSHRIRS